MKSVLLLATLLLTPSLFANDISRAASDVTATRLAREGSLPLHAIGPYVQVGTFRILVEGKLGRPDARLADGTWLYHRQRIEGTAARGTVVIRFEGGRVSSLALVTPPVAAALLAPAANAGPAGLVATR